jgi:hypothetical protein
MLCWVTLTYNEKHVSKYPDKKREGTLGGVIWQAFEGKGRIAGGFLQQARR